MNPRPDHLRHRDQLCAVHRLGLPNALALLTLSHVLYGIFRYIFLVQVMNEGGSPDETLYKDKPILLTTVVYVITVRSLCWPGHRSGLGDSQKLVDRQRLEQAGAQ